MTALRQKPDGKTNQWSTAITRDTSKHHGTEKSLWNVSKPLPDRNDGEILAVYHLVLMVEMFSNVYVALVKEQEVRKVRVPVGLAKGHAAFPPHFLLQLWNHLASHLLEGFDSYFFRCFRIVSLLAFRSRATDPMEWCRLV